MAKQMKKVAQGAKKREGVTWFTDLSDKSTYSFLIPIFVHIHVQSYFHCFIVKSTKVHLYWAMKNCCGTKEDLQKRVLNISKHYQVIVLCRIYGCSLCNKALC